MAREHGFLKEDALRQGYRDQWSQTLDGVTRTVEILMYEGEILGASSVTEGIDIIEQSAQVFGPDIHAARRFFRREVRRLKRRA